ncbi:MAG: hypothetical protein OZX49_01444 [Immundisolibacter sp.]|nr:hypothetical protein [Immundisolibacter sp.]
MDVHVLVGDDEHLDERVVGRGGVQRLPRVGLGVAPDLDEAGVVGRGLLREVHVEHAGQVAVVLQVLEERGLEGNGPQARALRRRELRQDGAPGRLLAVRDGRHFHEVGHDRLGHEAVGLAKRRFRLQLHGGDAALDDDLGVGRHQQVDGLGLHHRQRPTGQGAGHVQLVGLVGNLGVGGVGHVRRHADDQRRFQRNAQALALDPVQAQMLRRIGEAADAVRGFYLTAVVADVVDAGLGVLGDPVREGGVRPVVVAGRGNRNREFAQAAVLGQRGAHVDFFLTRRVGDHFRRQGIAQRVGNQLQQVVARLHAKAGLEDFPRRRQAADGQIAAEAAPVGAAHVLEQKAAPLVFLQAAELEPDQRMGFGLDGDRRVDFPQQVAGAQVLYVLPKIDGHVAGAQGGFQNGGHGGFLLIGKAGLAAIRGVSAGRRPARRIRPESMNQLTETGQRRAACVTIRAPFADPAPRK